MKIRFYDVYIHRDNKNNEQMRGNRLNQTWQHPEARFILRMTGEFIPKTIYWSVIFAWSNMQ